jgi:hypothetical protein
LTKPVIWGSEHRGRKGNRIGGEETLERPGWNELGKLEHSNFESKKGMGGRDKKRSPQETVQTSLMDRKLPLRTPP